MENIVLLLPGRFWVLRITFPPTRASSCLKALPAPLPSFPAFPEAQRVSRRPGAEREAPKKRSPALINGLIPTKRLWSRAQPRARESCQREGKEGEREEARAVPAGAD